MKWTKREIFVEAMSRSFKKALYHLVEVFDDIVEVWSYKIGFRE